MFDPISLRRRVARRPGTPSLRAVLLATILAITTVAPAAAADPSASPQPTPTESPTPASSDAPSATPPTDPGSSAAPAPGFGVAATLGITLDQAAQSYDAATNRAVIAVTVGAPTAAAAWTYTVAVRGTAVATGSTSATSITVNVTNDCSITTQSLTTTVTDAVGDTGSVAATLDRSLCPPPPAFAHARDRILAGPTLTEESFVDRLRAVGSPALGESRAIYRTLVAAGVNPAFALGTFHAESHSGTRGYAVVTKNWGNILYYSWEIPYGATPYAPGNGYTYAKYPTWLASVQAYAALLNRYHTSGYQTVSSASAHWLGTIEGSDRHLRYLTNITNVMSILPDDAVPTMTALSVPARSRAAVRVSWSAKDNLAVTGYQVRAKRGTAAWAPTESTTERTRTLTLSSGAWTIAVRATDAAGNWSAWRYAKVTVDAGIPLMTRLSGGQTIVRSASGATTATWAATDNVGVTGYQYRTQRSPDGAPSSAVTTTGRSGSLKFAAGTWILQVRARDAVGNWSDWRELRFVVPRDDRAFSFSAGTVRRTGSSYYRGTLTTSRVANAQITTSIADGTGFYLVGSVGPSYGRLRVTVDGVSTIVDTGVYQGRRATSLHHRVLLFSTRLATGPHTVTITNLATSGRPTIAIDGLGFSR